MPVPDRRGRVRVVVGIAAAAVVVVLGLVLVLVVRQGVFRGVPSLPALTQNPDPSLHGTVAYYADRTSCVRVVAAAGSPSKDVLCIPPPDVTKAEKLGKELGPQLVWRADGRLEVTMFRMTDPPGPSFTPGWQKIVDVRTGTVEDVPDAAAPSTANLDTRPLTNAAGARLSTTSDEDDGKVEIILNEGAASRVLLSAQGPGNHTYRLTTAFWAPDERWIAAYDGRILVVTPSDPAITRVLVADLENLWGGDDPRQSGFAVTGADLLPTPS